MPVSQSILRSNKRLGEVGVSLGGDYEGGGVGGADAGGGADDVDDVFHVQPSCDHEENLVGEGFDEWGGGRVYIVELMYILGGDETEY